VAKHKPKQFWAAHVAAAGSSGTSKVDYCRLHGIKYKSLLRWGRRLRHGDDTPSTSQSLVPVAIREVAPGRPPTLTLRIGLDISLAMPTSIDAVWLGTMLRTVAAC
jgi:transposase-like protein